MRAWSVRRERGRTGRKGGVERDVAACIALVTCDCFRRAIGFGRRLPCRLTPVNESGGEQQGQTVEHLSEKKDGALTGRAGSDTNKRERVVGFSCLPVVV